MDAMVYAVTHRIVWCRRQRAHASSQIELESWRAEEEGLRDAVLHRDHVHKYRSRSEKMLERYLLGFQDAKALLRTARTTHSATPFAIEHTEDRFSPDGNWSHSPDSTDHLACH